MDPSLQAALRELPSVDEALRAVGESGAPRWALVQAVREAIDGLRQRLKMGESVTMTLDDAALHRRVAELIRPSLRRVINATGVVLHTNLGRAPLCEAAMARVAEVAQGYSNLEYRLDQRRRGSRHEHAAALLREVCGAEDALVVNNNAAAVMLCLAALARGREVIVSRGELIEIGGSFRLPEVMALSGGRLREVGTTNRTHLRDYAGAITEQTALLLKVHRSNFAMIGFIAETDSDELVALGAQRGVPTMFDLGSGTLVDLREYALPAEPTVAQEVKRGFDLVTFSGDKLLGGPQAGLIVGKAEAVSLARSHPLMRALRPDKMTLAALEATLEIYRDGREGELPALSSLGASDQQLRARAERLEAALAERFCSPFALQLVSVTSAVGGGALPQATPGSWAVALTHAERSAEQLERPLRAADPPVVARIDDDQLRFDVRTLGEADLLPLARSAEKALK